MRGAISAASQCDDVLCCKRVHIMCSCSFFAAACTLQSCIEHIMCACTLTCVAVTLVIYGTSVWLQIMDIIQQPTGVPEVRTLCVDVLKKRK